MDRDTLQGNVRGKLNNETSDSTRVLRRSPTTGEANAAEHGRTGVDPVQSTASSASPAPVVETEWTDDNLGMEGSGSQTPGRSRQDSMGATTPTLIDEPDFIDEDEEEEMISYERERLIRNTHGLFAGDAYDNLRRTPGASMYRSSFQDNMRRTPGAQQMHMSAAGPATAAAREPGDSGAGDASGLGFGLTLSTPVASRGAKPLNLASTWDASLARGSVDHSERPPLPGQGLSRDERRAFVTPLNLSKEGTRQGVYSPNTLRLTEDLGNLLLEDDNEADTSASSGIFGFDGDKATIGGQSVSDEKQQNTESWTAPYIIQMGAPTRVPRSSTRVGGRRGKTDGARRSRGYDRPSFGSRLVEDNASAKTGGFLQYAQQPKAVRSGQFDLGEQTPHYNLEVEHPKVSSSSHGSQGNMEEGSSGPTQSFLNFGGAFAPPSKHAQSQDFHEPVASNAPPQQEMNAGPFFQPQYSGHAAFSGNAGQFVAAPFHNPFQQPGLPQFGDQQGEKFQPQFGSQQPFMFGSSPSPVNPSPTFNMPPQGVAYPMHGVPMHPPQAFMPVMHHPQHVPQYEQHAPPGNWGPSPVGMQGYDALSQPMDHHRLGWRHGGPAGWPLGEYAYAMPRMSESPAHSISRGTPTWTPEPELVAAEGSHTPVQQSQAGLAPSPTSSTGKGSKKAQRKNLKKATKPPPKADRSTPPSQVSQGKKVKKKPPKSNLSGSTPTPTEEISQALSEDIVDTSRRVEADETPETKAAFKEFTKRLRAEERTSFKSAQGFAVKALSDGSLPESIHWKVYLELADLAKRANRFNEARSLYQKVCGLQPHAIQGWLEFSKLEEECGNMNICAKILRAGIEYCDYNDGLYARAIKHEEKMGDISRARELLSRLKHLKIENVWRTVLEGALLEARTGNHVMARRVLKYLMHHVPWYGPLYLEAYKLEKNLGRSREALEVVERGLLAIPRYGPLWFGAFKLCEELDQSAQKFTLPQTMAMIDRATLCVSKEIIWKVHLEAAQMLERCAVEFLDPTMAPTAKVVMDISRKRFARTILTCPPNLRWKVWLAAGRMEVAAGNTDRARTLFLRSHKVVPDKGRAVALLECARLEEFVGDVDLAGAILCKSRAVNGSDWKVWLESVLLEIRCGNRVRAIELASTALKLHSGTGRLWASLIQLYHYEEGEAKQFETLRYALNAVPKSGEVWCEGARIHLNPFSRTFDLPSAQRHLSFATKFTPQYGDGFLETLRLEIIEQWLVPTAKLVWEMTRKQFDLSEEANQEVSLVDYVGKISCALFLVCRSRAGTSLPGIAIHSGLASMIRSRLKPAFRDSTVDLSDLYQRCANADPNYGLLWFHCRETPSGTARQIMARATELMQNEIGTYAHVHLAALVRRIAILTQIDRNLQRKAKALGDDKAPREIVNTAQWEETMIKAFLSAPSLREILSSSKSAADTPTGMVLLESTMTGSKFVSGLVALCDQVSVSEMSSSSSEKRKALFGTDALFS